MIKPVIPSITDFRDPWSKLDLLDDFHLSKGSRSKHIQLEKQVLENSDLVLTVSEKWAADFKNLGSSNVKIITNGYEFRYFHLISFTNDLWILDPRRDYLIMMFPQGFFFDSTMFIAMGRN